MALNFSSTFVQSSLNQVLAPSNVFNIQLTPIINQTAPLSANGKPTFSAIWSSSFNVKIDELFSTETQYTFFQRAQTNITVILEETVFYVSNAQKPIARQTEVIFHTLLFTIVVLEIFGLLFLVIKLMITPLCRTVGFRVKACFSKRKCYNMDVIDNLPTELTIRTDNSMASPPSDSMERSDRKRSEIHTILQISCDN